MRQVKINLLAVYVFEDITITKRIIILKRECTHVKWSLMSPMLVLAKSVIFSPFVMTFIEHNATFNRVVVGLVHERLWRLATNPRFQVPFPGNRNFKVGFSAPRSTESVEVSTWVNNGWPHYIPCMANGSRKAVSLPCLTPGLLRRYKRTHYYIITSIIVVNTIIMLVNS